LINTTDGRTEEGVTVGRVDELLSIARNLVRRDRTPLALREALLDLASDEDIQALLERACNS
jgi:hypothetical protein